MQIDNAHHHFDEKSIDQRIHRSPMKSHGKYDSKLLSQKIPRNLGLPCLNKKQQQNSTTFDNLLGTFGSRESLENLSISLIVLGAYSNRHRLLDTVKFEKVFGDQCQVSDCFVCRKNERPFPVTSTGGLSKLDSVLD